MAHPRRRAETGAAAPLIVAATVATAVVALCCCASPAHSLAPGTPHGLASPHLAYEAFLPHNVSGSDDPDVDTVYRRYVLSLLVPADDVSAAMDHYQDFMKHFVPSNCTWADIDYTNMARADWPAGDHMERVQAMAALWATPKSPLHNNKTLLNTTACAFHAWTSRDLQNPNWWWNQIGIPQMVGRALLLLTPTNVPYDSEIAKVSIAIMNRATWWIRTGANRIWELNIKIMQGLFFGSTPMVSNSFSAVYKTVSYVHQPQEGIQVDGSFHQHGPELLAGSYGAEFTSIILGLLQMASGTRFYMGTDTMRTFGHLVLDGQQWMVVGHKAQDWSVIGREITRPHGTHEWPFSPEQLRNVTAGKRTGEFKTFGDWLAGESKTKPVLGARHFYDSDYAVLHTPAFDVSVRMFSKRTVNARCVNHEGTQSEHTADGVVNLYYSGHEYDGIYPVWDWKQLPGTTIPQYPHTPSCDTTTRESPYTFVGGVVAPSGGSVFAGMRLSTHGLDVMRFFVLRSDVIISVDAFANFSADASGAHGHKATGTSGVGHAVPNSNSGNNPLSARGVGGVGDGDATVVTTTAANRLLKGDVTIRLANETHPRTLPRGEYNISAAEFVWIHHDNTGYTCALFPCPAVRIINTEQEGDWSLIGVSSGKVKQDVFTLMYNHGSTLNDVRFAHLVLPNVTAEAMPDAIYMMGQVTVQAEYSRAVSVLVADSSGKGYAAYHAVTDAGKTALPSHGVASTSAPAFVAAEVNSKGKMAGLSGSSPVASGKLALQLASATSCAGTDTVDLDLPTKDNMGQTVAHKCN